MTDSFEMKIIAHMRSDFPSKFGIPRQSSLVDSVSYIVFEKEYRVDEALRGIEGYSHLWIIWKFSECERSDWSPTVRPPRLGGNKRMGVFATRSPFRPNPIGLSSVEMIGVEKTSEGSVIAVRGADLMDGTPIYDIKPYLPFTDCHPDAKGGFADEQFGRSLEVVCPEEFLQQVDSVKRKSLMELLTQDPRPAYIEDPERVYGFEFADVEIRFSVGGDVLTVLSIEKIN